MNEVTIYSLFPQVVQKHYLDEVANKYRLTAYFLRNICAKNYQNRLM